MVLLVSFHGDSGGMASGDVMKTIAKIHKEKYSDHKLVIGIDANTHSDSVADGKKKYGVSSFDALLKELGFATCFGGLPTRSTVNSARTYLQPQLNKAVKREDLLIEDADHRSPKDYIVFVDGQFGVKEESIVDNTAQR